MKNKGRLRNCQKPKENKEIVNAMWNPWNIKRRLVENLTKSEFKIYNLVNIQVPMLVSSF